MKTPQELFDITVRHLAKQGKPAQIGHMCALRSEDGKLSCAIGCHIPDELYKPEMDDKIGSLAALLGAIDPDTQSVLSAAGIGEDSVDLMADLQNVHDGCTPDLWCGAFRAAGFSKSLSLAVFDEPDVKAQFDVLCNEQPKETT